MEKVSKFWIISGVIILINIIGYLTLKGDALLYFSDLLPVICSAIAIIGVFSVIKHLKEFDFLKVAWLLIFIGLIFDFVAEGLYSIFDILLEKDMNNWFPSTADYFWFAAYIFFFTSLFIMLSKYVNSGLPLGKLKAYILIIVVLTAIIVVAINMLLVPIVNDPETALSTKIASLFYPIADILVACLAVVLMYIINQYDNKLISMPWKIMAFGYILFSASDMIYSYLSWQETYGSGNFIDIGWNAGYLLLGISGLYQVKLIKSFREGGKS